MTENIKFGLALKVLREARGLSAKELSMRAGLADYTVSRIERGTLNLDFVVASLLTQHLEISLDTLAETAAKLPQDLVESEFKLAQARDDVKKLRVKTRYLRQRTR